MKNKKLFAILTLVCFMFTLMPVAAFAAAPEVGVMDGDKLDQSITVIEGSTTAEAIEVVLQNPADLEDGENYIFVVFEGNELYKVADIDAALNLKAALPGTYTVNAVVEQDIDGILDDDVLTDAEKAKLIQAKKSFVKDGLTIKVKADSSIKYSIVLTADRDINVYDEEDEAVAGKYAMTITANNGWSEAQGEVTATLYRGAEEVDNAELTFTKAGYVDLTFPEGTETDNGGDVDFEVTSTRTGEYTVIVKYGTKAKAELAVSVIAETVANVAVENAPKAPIAIDEDVENHEIEFKFTDASGRAYDPVDENGDLNAAFVKVQLTEKPADSTLEKDAFTLIPTADKGVWVVSGADFDEEGTYTVKVVLKNGKSAEATIKVAEMGEVVGIKYDVYNTPRTVGYGEATALTALLAYDANGVTRNVSEVAVYSANGYAVEKINWFNHPLAGLIEKNGGLIVKNDDDFIGSTITVYAEHEGFVASTVLTVVDKAASISFADATAEVGVNTEITGNVVDSNGNISSIKTYIDGLTGTASVLEKPANAVAVANWYVNDKGAFVVDFLASEKGTYKVLVSTAYTDGTGTDRYVSGIATITVGAGEGTFEDVVVMSIGANKVVVNSEVKDLVAAPMIKDARTFVPFRALAEAFGADVEWVEATQSVVAELNGVKVVMNIGENAYTVNGAAKTADVAPFINGASTMVPVRFVAEAFGINVTPIYAENGAVADVLFAK